MRGILEIIQIIGSFLSRIGINSILDLLALIGCIYFLFKRFILKKIPVPSSAFGRVPQELLQKCVTILKKKETRSYESYSIPEELLESLKLKLNDEEKLKCLLCDICSHLGINGSFIKLVVQDTPVTDRAGEISTDLAHTRICLEVKPYYTVDTVTAVLAHEAIHLHLYYEGIYLRDAWENEILTDTAAVYCGFGEYIYRGYAVMQGAFVGSYQKVGYIKQEDVQYIRKLIEEE